MEFLQSGSCPNHLGFFFEPSILYLLCLVKSWILLVLSSKPMMVEIFHQSCCIYGKETKHTERCAVIKWATSFPTSFVISQGCFGDLLPLSQFPLLVVHASDGDKAHHEAELPHVLEQESAWYFSTCCVLSFTRLTPLCLGFWKRVPNCHMERDISVLIFISMRLKVKHATTKLVYVIPLSEPTVMPKTRYLIGLWEKQMQKDAIPTI